MKFTIFTATFNRENTLSRLYESLLMQSFKNFEWLIVDDGSIDNTQELIQSFINENKIDINYFKQENGGKHRAINQGVKLAKGKLFFIVDSDDFLPYDSLEIINKFSINLTGDIVGLAGRRQYKDGERVGNSFPNEKFISDHIEKTYVNGLKGDLAEVLRTDILKEFPFPNYKGEKFCAESLIWNRIAKKFKILFIDTPIYVCEYLEGGLSDNSIKNRRKSPSYAMTIYKELSDDNRLPLKICIKTYVNYWRFSFFNHKSFSENWKNINYNILALLSYPLGYLMKIKDDMKSNENK